MPCGFPRALVLFAAAAVATGTVSAQGSGANVGVVFSEVAHGPSLPPFGGQPMPSYVELVNLQIANPVLPPPVSLAGATVGAVVNGVATLTVIPASVTGGLSFLGGNVQPPPAPQPPALPANPPVFLIASAPFPAGVLPPNARVHVDPAFFQPNFGAPGALTELCIVTATPTQFTDQVVIPPAVPTAGCGPIPFVVTNAFVNTTGHVSRWMYVDSETDIDFDPDFAPSPGVVNPEMSHVDGFLFGQPGTPGVPHPDPAQGAPLVFAGVTTGTLSGVGAVVTAVKFHNNSPPYDRIVTDPVFDRVIGAPATISGAFTATGVFQANLPGYLSGLNLAGSTVVITTSPVTPGGQPGVLTMPNGPSTLVDLGVEPVPSNPTTFRIRRLYTDSLADSGSTGTGETSDSQNDTLPGSTGGGNLWCEVIVYDAAGNRYKGKAKNWPPGPGCTTGPKLALGTTTGTGDGTLIDFCFNPLATVYNIFAATPASSCGGPVLFGLCMDPLFVSLISPPFPLVTDPINVFTDTDGVYGWSVPAGALLSLVGTTLYGVGVEYTGSGVVQASSTSSVTF
jgi:hypothetical protein